MDDWSNAMRLGFGCGMHAAPAEGEGDDDEK